MAKGEISWIQRETTDSLLRKYRDRNAPPKKYRPSLGK